MGHLALSISLANPLLLLESSLQPYPLNPKPLNPKFHDLVATLTRSRKSKGPCPKPEVRIQLPKSLQLL